MNGAFFTVRWISDARNLAYDRCHLLRVTVSQINEKDLLTLVGYKANPIHMGTSGWLRSDCPKTENLLRKCQAALRKRLTVSFHCPLEVSPSAISPGQVRDTYFGGPVRKTIRWRGSAALICS